MNGRWALQYTTALNVLGRETGFLRPKGAIFQTVDIFTLQVKNEESFEPLPFIKFTNEHTSDLNAQTDSRASVRPKDYRVAGFKVDAPPSSPGRGGAKPGDGGDRRGVPGLDGHHVRGRGGANLEIAVGRSFHPRQG